MVRGCGRRVSAADYCCRLLQQQPLTACLATCLTLCSPHVCAGDYMLREDVLRASALEVIEYHCKDADRDEDGQSTERIVFGERLQAVESESNDEELRLAPALLVLTKRALYLFDIQPVWEDGMAGQGAGQTNGDGASAAAEGWCGPLVGRRCTKRTNAQRSGGSRLSLAVCSAARFCARAAARVPLWARPDPPPNAPPDASRRPLHLRRRTALKHLEGVQVSSLADDWLMLRARPERKREGDSDKEHWLPDPTKCSQCA